MQRRPSSQATSTLSNTPNLYIGSYTGNPMLVPRPVHQTENSTLVLLPGQATLVVRTLFFDLHKQDSASRKLQQTLCFAPASLLLVLFASTLTEEYHLYCVDSDCLPCVCQAFGSMLFGYLRNFLDLSHRFCKSHQLVHTQLLQCSIARRGPSKTVSFL